MVHELYLKLAVEEALAGIRANDGGPFGAVIVKGGRVIGSGHNTVLRSHDPTAHAEINAIRDACRNTHHHHLTDAVIYTNFEPCPMCLAAIYWANIRSFVYAAGRDEAERIGFMDNQLYQELSLPPGAREVVSARIPIMEMELLLEEWNGLEGRILY